MLFSNSSYSNINQSVTEKVAVLPLGAIEQHGPHLPVSVDTDIVHSIASSAEKLLPNDMLLCPALQFGSSHHHLSFGGTLSMSASTYTQVIVELTESLLQNGFRRIVLLNGHGGNIIPAKQALTLLSNQYDAIFQPNIALVTYWELSEGAFSGEPPMESPALSHACEYETSLMLHLFPEKLPDRTVRRSNHAAPNDFISWENEQPFAGVTMMKQTRYISDNGSSGEPQLASAEKGEHLFNHAVNKLVQFITSFRQWPLMKSLQHNQPKNFQHES
jgi:creatinine amidohydrolase